jgi:hypothetical protein
MRLVIRPLLGLLVLPILYEFEPLLCSNPPIIRFMSFFFFSRLASISPPPLGPTNLRTQGVRVSGGIRLCIALRDMALVIRLHMYIARASRLVLHRWQAGPAPASPLYLWYVSLAPRTYANLILVSTTGPSKTRPCSKQGGFESAVSASNVSRYHGQRSLTTESVYVFPSRLVPSPPRTP